MKQPVNTVNHVLVLYKLAAVGLLNTSLHSGDEAGLIFEHPGNSILHQLLGILAVGNSHLLEPRFNVGREMHFHALKVRENRLRSNTETRASPPCISPEENVKRRRRQ